MMEKLLLPAMLIACTMPLPAIANPFITDDPETVDYQHWEIDIFSAGGRAGNQTSGTLPGLEVDYGVLPNAELHVITPLNYGRIDGHSLYYGYGDTELGIKYRFLNSGKDDWWPEVAVFPLLEIPTGNAARGLGSTGDEREFLPVWLQKEYGAWTAGGGAGYWHNPGMGNRDNWFFGWTLQRKITAQLSLGGELFYQTSETITTTPYPHGSSGFNLGGTYDVNETYHVLFAAGQGIQNIDAADKFTYYLGLQLTY